ncbi:MAG: hypothetical protein AAFP26_00505, partial [Planctomycetota bacterium]
DDERERSALLEAACVKYTRAITYCPVHADAWNNYGNALVKFSELHDGIMKLRLLRSASRAHKRSSQLEPTNFEPYANRANTLAQVADRIAPARAVKLLAGASALMQNAHSLNAADAGVLRSWGHILLKLAVVYGQSGSNKRGVQLLEEALERFDKAGSDDDAGVVTGLLQRFRALGIDAT